MELKSERPKTTQGWASIPLDPAHKSNQPLVDEDVRVIEDRQDTFLLDRCRDCGLHFGAKLGSGFLDDLDLVLMPTVLQINVVHCCGLGLHETPPHVTASKIGLFGERDNCDVLGR
jgi:hypothetical protein